MDIHSDAYEIIRYRPEFRQQVLQLQAGEWTSDPQVSGTYLDWKYHHNPYLKTPIVHLAVHAGRVVGMRGMVGSCWEGGRSDQVYLGVSDADAVVHSDHRRRGLLKRMTMMALEDLTETDCQYVITLSANQSSAESNLKLGWKLVGNLQTARWHQEYNAQQGLRHALRNIPVARHTYQQLRRSVLKKNSSQLETCSPFAALDEFGTAASRLRRFPHLVIEAAPRPEEMAELVARIGSDGRLRHVRDQRFTLWRYQNPLSIYRFLYWGDSRLEGYLVLQVPAFAVDNVWCTVVDCQATSLNVSAELIRAAVEGGAFQTFQVWTESLSSELNSLLQAVGFLSNTKSDLPAACGPCVLARAIHKPEQPGDWMLANRSLLDLANWDLRAIDSDSF